MDNALVPALPSGVARPADGVMARLTAVPVKAMVMLTLGVAALAAVIAALAMWSKGGDYRVLYANLSDKDGGAIVSQLSQMNVPYRHADGGNAILVPADKVHDVRLRLAQAGLPRGSSAGFELLDNARFGQTQFQERLTWQRALEGELVRSISSLAAVQSARVHLALPAQNGFLRERQKPSASVLLSLHPGRTLDRSQVAGIVHLVASSVPELAPGQVSVIDQTGALLSADGESLANGMDASQLNYVHRMEAGYSQRVLDLLEPIVGAGNVRAQISADIDFTQSESTAEQYRPNQGAEPAAVRSQQVLESGAHDAATAQGVPGALSNQPPAPAAAPVNGPAQPTHAAVATAQGAANGGRREAVTNYEVDKTVRVTRNASGTIKRLSAAVLVNHRRSVDAEGKVTLAALAPAELENIHSLVREAIGFNRERGDSINVVNAPFTQIETPREVALPAWQQPENIALARELGKQGLLVVLALIVIFTLIRPVLKAFARPRGATGARLAAQVDDPLQLPEPGTTPPAVAPVRQEEILRIARENPAAVASVVRNWVGSTARGS